MKLSGSLYVRFEWNINTLFSIYYPSLLSNTSAYYLGIFIVSCIICIQVNGMFNRGAENYSVTSAVRSDNRLDNR